MNDEARMTKRVAADAPFGHSSLEFHSSLLIRHSSFGLAIRLQDQDLDFAAGDSDERKK